MKEFESLDQIPFYIYLYLHFDRASFLYPQLSRTSNLTLAIKMVQLPDPTVDLDWSGYVGSIQSHFSKNAENHPDRVCVIETKSSETPERTFTYRQIHEASNLLAHYLHDAGVENGDVVMVWGHRSVDLVVSIMGTLV